MAAGCVRVVYRLHVPPQAESGDGTLNEFSEVLIAYRWRVTRKCVLGSMDVEVEAIGWYRKRKGDDSTGGGGAVASCT